MFIVSLGTLFLPEALVLAFPVSSDSVFELSCLTSTECAASDPKFPSCTMDFEPYKYQEMVALLQQSENTNCMSIHSVPALNVCFETAVLFF